MMRGLSKFVYCVSSAIIFLIFLNAVHCLPRYLLEDEDWNEFKLKYNRQYADEIEEQMRFNIFQENKKFIASHNERYEKGEVSYYLGINDFADLSDDEFFKRRTGYKPNNITRYSRKPETTKLTELLVSEDVPDEFDWRKQGAITRVKNQGACGSCWAFCAVAALESHYYLATGELKEFSEQNLLDCMGIEEHDTCKGGLSEWAYTYAEIHGGIALEEDYPYKAEMNRCHHYNASAAHVTDEGYFIHEYGDEINLLHALIKDGPLSVSIDAKHPTFKQYRGGVYYDESCSSSEQEINHCVLLVGYGKTEKGEDYWILKNSDGAEWGEDGYMKLARNRDNACGVATKVEYPVRVHLN